MGTIVRKLAATGAAAAAAIGARRAVELGWRMVRDEEPPSAADVTGDTELRDLLLWSAIVAVAIIVARKIAVGATEGILGAPDED